jgi:tRNA A-37 threonylcarbamoyl transferase component Bud32
VAVDLDRMRWLARLRSVDGQVVAAGVLLGTRHILTGLRSLDWRVAELLVDLVNLPDVPPVRARVSHSGMLPDIVVLELDEPQPEGFGAELRRSGPATMRAVRIFGFPRHAESGVWIRATAAGGDELVQLAGNDLNTEFAGGPVLDDETGQLLGIVTVTSAQAWLVPADTLIRHFPQVAAWSSGVPPATVGAKIHSSPVPTRARFCAGCGSPVGRPYRGWPARDWGHCANCGQRFDFTPPLAPGDVVAGRYEVVGYLAVGGFSWVFLARDRLLDDTVVLKSVPAESPLAVTEGRLLSMVDEPGVVRVKDFVRHDGGMDFLVMEYVEGPSLRDVLTARAPLPPAEVAAYGVEILSIVARLHRRGVLHSDIKPDNLLQTGNRLTLIDLGAARLISDRTSPVIGTVGYIVSNEELDTHGPTVRADLYAVGQTLRKLMDATGPESLRRLIARALAPYEQRYATADEMRDQLTGVLRELLSEQDLTPRPAPSTLFTAMTAPLDGGLGDIPGSGTIACPPPDEVAAALPAVRDSADATLRADWQAGVDALAAGDVEAAEAAFDRCYSAVPGELAPQVALAFCAELRGRAREAVAHYEKVWRRDPAVGCAAFGLARLVPDRAVDVLDGVPDHSPCRNRARIAAVRMLTSTLDALARIPLIGLDRVAEARLTASVLEAVPAGLQAERETLAVLYRRIASYDPNPRLGLAVDRVQTGDTLTVTVWVTANRRVKDVRYTVWTTRGTRLLAAGETGVVGDLRRGDRHPIHLTLQTRAEGTPPGEAVVADIEVSVGGSVAVAAPIVGIRTEPPGPNADDTDRRGTFNIRNAAGMAVNFAGAEQYREVSAVHSSSVSAILDRPDVRPPSRGEAVLARVRCDADVVVPGQRTRVALAVWAGEQAAPLDEPVALRVVLDSAPADVSPVSRVTVLSDDRTMAPVDFDVVPEEAGPLPLVFRVYRDADSHLLLEVQAELPVEAAS